MIRCVAKTSENLQCERAATYKVDNLYLCWQHAESDIKAEDDEQDVDFEPVYKVQTIGAKKRYVFQRQSSTKDLLSAPYQDLANGCFQLTEGMANLLKDRAIIDFGINKN
jgi:hypothetical protein